MTENKNSYLVKILAECAEKCNHCASACLEERDMKLLKDCIKLDLDCADICQLTATLIGRDSPHAEHLLKECVEVCTACATECEKHAHMEHCKVCAETCRTCAELCSQVVMV